MSRALTSRLLPHSSHWGAFHAAWSGADVELRPHPIDPDPNPILDNFRTAVRHRARVTSPAVRRGWLERGPSPDPMRGRDEFVEMSWDEVLDRLAAELERVKREHGAGAVFGGSYGWSSAGRFHHAQSQVHRFLNKAISGYVRSVNSYSSGAASVILPHVLGHMESITRRNVTWEQVVEHTEVVLAFGGMALKNSRVASGGVSRHVERSAMLQAAKRGCRFFCISPIRSDLPSEARAEWVPVQPFTDTAMMLALVHTLVVAGLHDASFLERYCDGWSEFEGYLMGRVDGVPKSARWAAPICGLEETFLRDLALSLRGKRVLVAVSHSLQRAEHGEQPVWMGVVLAAVLGQLGLPGGGYNYALGSMAHYGKRNNAISAASLPQGINGVRDFIPVARIADMLLHPGDEYDYNGERRTYPHIRLAYWAGGNPFHHHQHLGRLSQALTRLDTFVVHEIAWTATARHADIVLPCTMTLEREDIGVTQTDPLLVAMHRIVEPHGQARDDYDIFCALADRLGTLGNFSEGCSARQWLQRLYEPMRRALEASGLEAPTFEEFWERGELTLPSAEDDGGILRAFRTSPADHPLQTPSGRVQITSPTITGFGYADCPGHAAWIPPTEVPSDTYPLIMVANQPATRLHSQLDYGAHSQAEKRSGREVCRIHPRTAAERGIADGDIVRLFNARGACLAAARLSEDQLANVVQLPTGAWYDPVAGEAGTPLCVHGNPNTLTRDIGTSSLGQGCAGQLTVVQIERYDGPLPPIRTYDPPLLLQREHL